MDMGTIEVMIGLAVFLGAMAFIGMQLPKMFRLGKFKNLKEDDREEDDK